MSRGTDRTGARGLAVVGDVVFRVSGKAAANGQELLDRAAALSLKIDALADTKPWGNDDYGNGYEAKVHDLKIGEGQTFYEHLQQMLQVAGKEMVDQFGPRGRQSAALYEETDAADARRMTA